MRTATWVLALLLAWWMGRAQGPGQAQARGPEQGFASIVARANPSVVRIAIRQAGGARRASRDDGVGGGFIVGAGGLVATSRHVLGGARDVIVTAPGAPAVRAHVLGSDPQTDVALLRVSALADRPPLVPAPPDALQVGDWLLACGAPFSLANSWSLGIVSGLNRSGVGVNPRGYESFIQTDAAANLGSSGGPVLDASGRVVGMMTAILSRSGTHQGVGLVTPLHAVLQSVARLGGGAVTPAPLSLGLHVRPAPGGLLVTRLDAGSAAQQGGLRTGDLLTALDGQPLTQAAAIQRRLWSGRTDPLRFDLVRNGQRGTLAVHPPR